LTSKSGLIFFSRRLANWELKKGRKRFNKREEIMSNGFSEEVLHFFAEK